jgi:cytochrome c
MPTKIRLMVAMALGLGMAAGPAAARPDIDAGRFEFNKTCRSCHSLRRGEVIQGPSLAGVFGRRAGSLVDFNYTDTMRNSRIIWTEDSLDTYIASPFMMLGSGIDMTAHGIRDDRARADLIEFLKHAR